MEFIEKVCPECGSDSVIMDASAEWCASEQQWVLASTHEGAACGECGWTGDQLEDRVIENETKDKT